MKNRKMLIALLGLLALLLTGCAMRPVEEMYALPRRSRAYDQLQSAIDDAMEGMTYSAPIAGENRQTVQVADLDGDGVEEYLVFAAGDWKNPLQVLIFSQNADGTCELAGVIETNGSAFEQVEYVAFDEKPGLDLVIGRQVSDQVLRIVTVYSFSSGSVEQLLSVGYSRFLTCDLDENGRSEVMVIRPGVNDGGPGVAVLYSTRDGRVQRSAERELSMAPERIRRIQPGKLAKGIPGVFVSGTEDGETVITDILAMSGGKFTNVAALSHTDTIMRAVQGFYVYPEDIDGDGVTELPSTFAMKEVSLWEDNVQEYLLRWYSLDEQGREREKRITYHDFAGGWYLELKGSWAGRVSVEQDSGDFRFYVWDESYQEAVPLFNVHIFTDSDRDVSAASDGRFPLHRTEGVAYAASLESGAGELGITKESILESFRLIRPDRLSEES